MIRVPEAVWVELLDRIATQTSTESVAYLDGYADRDDSVVACVVIPDAKLEPFSYTVSASAMSAAGQHLRVFKMVRLAQVHTHPEEWVGHSPRDDRDAYSQDAGSVSIVLPDRARYRPALHECGILVREGEGWRELTAQEKRLLIQVVPSVIDLRSGSR